MQSSTGALYTHSRDFDHGDIAAALRKSAEDVCRLEEQQLPGHRPASPGGGKGHRHTLCNHTASSGLYSEYCVSVCV